MMMHSSSSFNAAIIRYSRYTGAPIRQQLVVFPHAGGTASFYKGWREQLPDDCDLFVVRYPGRDERQAENPWQDAQQAIEACCRGLQEMLGIAPVTFFGHSMGAILALQTALALRTSRFRLHKVVISSQRIPASLLNLQHEPQRQSLLSAILRQDSGMALDELTRPTVEKNILQDLTLLGQLAALPVDDIRLHVIGGNDDPLVSDTDLKAWAAISTSAQVSLRAGGHFYFQQNTNDFLRQLIQ
ncbi:thioesterase II family protein [Pantoea sp. A4]|uniref:thioesterase II family protein n=1 Tax=Pantoea sp. A4 TaxID=1225184 RepID=UPI00037F30E4|nr:alpha/beta fold hydrolase [Pantoea sp. A4]